MSHSSAPDVSERVLATDAPVIVKTKQLMAGASGVLSLAQGVVHWAPPAAALEAAVALVGDTRVSAYGPCHGLPELVEALQAKLASENALPGHEVMVTAGANQAFVNIVLTLLDAGDRAVLFRPYYFNHLMALQMTGGARGVVLGSCHPDSMHPDLDWLEAELAGPRPPRLVVLINPCNPTGVLLARAELERAAELTRRAGAWLVMDNTYEHFVYGGAEHVCIAAPHILHVFSFSKAFGMMGWRVGYIAYQGAALGEQLLKVQDTIPICPPQLSQHLALGAVSAGRPWVAERVSDIAGNREVLVDALAPLARLGPDYLAASEGAIYLWAKLPPGCEDDEAVVAWLVRAHGVCIIPGSACGAFGYAQAWAASSAAAMS
ncbi:hypothetical protein WJX81_001094 [Elliptochloris bilobata]|uniref:Aminotransferase class I/classII large domain-containing protein n=1 Tax=Elliptochloris bilobata TaxID=381761 RepID=A0AAW1S061_9CHLO